VLVTGAGPIGLLAALLAVQRGHQTYVLDRVTEGRKPEMVRRLGATYVHSGVSPVGTESVIDPGLLNRNMVLQNSVLFGSVNANRQHYELAAKALAQADPRWLADLITRQVPLNQWADAYARQPDDIKTVLAFP
jgi:threonine dehydrogenase-like Zn-dependent dehydrogenase